MVKKERIGYLREVKIGGRIGRIYPADEVKIYGYKAEAKDKKYKE